MTPWVSFFFPLTEIHTDFVGELTRENSTYSRIAGSHLTDTFPRGDWGWPPCVQFLLECVHVCVRERERVARGGRGGGRSVSSCEI